MFKSLRNSLPVLALLVVPLFSASASSNGVVFSPQAQDDPPSELLCGELADMPGVDERLDEMAEFEVDMDEVSESNVSEFDEAFIMEGIAGNMLEIETLEHARDRVDNEEFRCLIDMMLVMHEKDLEALVDLAETLDLETSPDLTNAEVYPHTPDYDLGMRTVNLVEMFLDPLREGDDGDRFDEKAAHIIKAEHVHHVESSLTAVRLNENEELKAFAKHGADVAKMHILLLDHLAYRVFFDIEVPLDFDEPYEDPREGLMVNGENADN